MKKIPIIVLAPHDAYKEWLFKLKEYQQHSFIVIVDEYNAHDLKILCDRQGFYYVAHKRIAGKIEAIKTGMRLIEGDKFALFDPEQILINEQQNAQTITLSFPIFSKSSFDEKALEKFTGSGQGALTRACKKEEVVDIIFFPLSSYHATSIALFTVELKKKNISYLVVDCSVHIRDLGLAQAIQSSDLHTISLNDFILTQPKGKTIVVFNDWDGALRPMINMANKIGIETIGIIEGIQDYHDIDTARERFAYQSVKHLCFSGSFDTKYFLNNMPDYCILGVPRILEMRKNKPQKKNNTNSKIALINSNFSYNVLVQHRDQWLKMAVNTAIEAGYQPLISRHPGDEGRLFPEYVSEKNFYESLKEADITIQRFASGILEALAYDKPVIYFNPKIEKIDKFTSPNSAFIYAQNKQELYLALIEPCFNPQAASDFLDLHAGAKNLNSADIFSNFILKTIESSADKHIDHDRFFHSLKQFDLLSHAYTNITPRFSKFDFDIEQEILHLSKQTPAQKKRKKRKQKIFSALRNIEQKFMLRRLMPQSVQKFIKRYVE